MTMRNLMLVAIAAASLTLSPLVLARDLPSPTSQSKGAYADVRGLRMYYEQKGSGSPVVLLHGGLGNIDDFAKQIDDLARQHRIIAIEQIGHGRTADSNEPFSYARMAEDTATLLSKLKIEHADVIGLSDGGIVALLLARTHPPLVRRLVASGANVRPILEVQRRLQQMTAEEMAAKFPAATREAYERLSPDGPRHWPIVVGKAKDLWATPVMVEPADLAAIQVPVLIVSGDRDVIPLEHSIEIFRALPNAQFCVIPGTGHDTFQEAPGILNPIIEVFLAP
jgi:pimeloyl-ACP methyl ester carboxylesterase